MGIKNSLGDVIVVDLPEQPQYGKELEQVNGLLCEIVDRDVVIDFANVQMLTSETICGLMILERLLRGAGRHLVLCSLPSAIKQIFVRTGLVSIFQFADDELGALSYLRSKDLSWAESRR
jgi:anti-anti-sigma regulatory factor